MVSKVWQKKWGQERLRKTKFIKLTSIIIPRNTESVHIKKSHERIIKGADSARREKPRETGHMLLLGMRVEYASEGWQGVSLLHLNVTRSQRRARRETCYGDQHYHTSACCRVGGVLTANIWNSRKYKVLKFAAHFLDRILWCTKVLNFDKVQFFYFFFCCLCFPCHVKRHEMFPNIFILKVYSFS